MENAYNIFIGEPEGKNHIEDLGVDGVKLEWILRNYGGICGLDSSGS
jgi:hypothetical protein